MTMGNVILQQGPQVVTIATVPKMPTCVHWADKKLLSVANTISLMLSLNTKHNKIRIASIIECLLCVGTRLGISHIPFQLTFTKLSSCY